jgi:UDP-N-acetyl-D-mannosaminuronic acid dehydrogenase
MQDGIVVIGLGDVGLATAVAFARRGCRVTGYDTDKAVVADLRKRARPLGPVFERALKDAAHDGALRFETNLAPADHNRTYIIAVPTPLRGSLFDDRPLTRAVACVQAVAAPRDLVVIRSTVPIGTTRSIARKLRSSDVDVACCPDRSISGKSFEEQFSIPHIIGAIDARSRRRAARLFALLGRVIEVGSPDAAEVTKLFANAQRDVAFALTNEFALICENLGLDMYEIGKAAATGYPRGSLSRPGPVGGPCLSKDSFLLAGSFSSVDGPRLSLAAREVNRRVIERIAATLAAHLNSEGDRGRVVTMLGVAFKGIPVTRETRGSAAVILMHALAKVVPEATFRAWDPVVGSAALSGLGFQAAEEILTAAAGASLVVVANDHPRFRRLSIRQIGAVMRKPALIYDLCGTIPRPAKPPAGVSVGTFGIGFSPAAEA